MLKLHFKRNLLATTGSLLFLLNPAAHGAWVVDPSAQVDTSYDDNVRLDPEDEDDAIVTTATVQARLRNVTEISQISGAAGLIYQRFDSYSGDQPLDNQAKGFVNFSANRRAERFNFGLRGSVRADTLLRRAREIPEGFDGTAPADGGADDSAAGLPDDVVVTDPSAIDPDIDDNLLREQVERQRFTVSPTMQYNVSERSRAQVGYSFYGLRYDSKGEDLGLEDSDTHSVFTQLSRDMTDRDSLSLRLQYSRFEPDQGLENDNYQATLGWQRRLSERAWIAVNLGGRRVESDVASDNGVVFSVLGSYDTEQGTFSGSVERSVLPSAYGDIVEADRLSFTYLRRLGERLSFSFNMNGYDTDSNGGNSNSNRKYIYLSPELNWSLSEAWSLSTGYTYRWNDSKNATSSASSNAVNLSLVYRPPSRL